ncbi:TerD family protein [Yinghuangia sp. ASG 101]|uniref:TerD family protein n=1 Tax=Yinghuangia sp. ASG 101 TaxID=2896848 RepID=UPI001E62FE6E|nr:TerD family protein [Yinghuangia sp. ASG 101]UGQ12208.1 TerD family protein [Yinghuangia sp. ASG 101]
MIATIPIPADYPRDYAVVDVETTGLTIRDRVISIAVVLLDATGSVTGRWATLVDPRRDPGPTAIHGLTSADLAGQPLFEEIADELAEHLSGRVVVAHNASFDWRMLDAEYGRLAREVPADERLCTIALAKRLELPLRNWRLETLAAHYGVAQQRAHDAEDDARVLARVFRTALHEAAHAELPLPVMRPGVRGVARVPAPRTPPKAPCPYVNPGRLRGDALMQGMRVAFTGETTVAREELEARTVAAGLAVTGSVSGRTSVLVTNDAGSGTGKNRAARDKGVPVVSEAVYVALLDAVRPGVRADADPAAPAAPAVPAVDAPSPPPAGSVRGGGTAGARPDRTSALDVLVLHDRWEHVAAGQLRALIVESGHRLRVNLTASVDVVVMLDGGVADPRAKRAASMGLECVHADDWRRRFSGGADAGPTAPAEDELCRELPRGGVHVLPGGTRPGVWTLQASWRWDRPDGEVDVVAFLLGTDEKVRRDDDFVFWNQLATPDGTVTIDEMGSAEHAVTIDLDALDFTVARVVVAAVVEGTSAFDAVGPIEVQTAPAQGSAHTRSILDAATVERVLLLGEFYRRGAEWRFRAQGQGHAFGVAELARRYGVDIDDQ